jgi:hypothetical protein
MLLNDIAKAQAHAGLIEEAAATFEEALTATLSDKEKWKTSHLVSMIRLIVDNGRGTVLMAASPTVRIRLVEAAEAITEIGVTRGKKPADPVWNPVDPLWPPRAQAAEMLSVIARALPN